MMMTIISSPDLLQTIRVASAVKISRALLHQKSLKPDPLELLIGSPVKYCYLYCIQRSLILFEIYRQLVQLLRIR